MPLVHLPSCGNGAWPSPISNPSIRSENFFDRSGDRQVSLGASVPLRFALMPRMPEPLNGPLRLCGVLSSHVGDEPLGWTEPVNQ